MRSFQTGEISRSTESRDNLPTTRFWLPHLINTGCVWHLRRGPAPRRR